MKTALQRVFSYFFIVFLLLVGVAETKAQHGSQRGYIVSTAGDTLRGMVQVGRDRRNSQLCFFKPTTKAAFQSYRPTQLLAYGAADLQYESHLLPKSVAQTDTVRKAFLQVVVRGALTLYYFQGELEKRFFLRGYRPSQLTELPMLTQKVIQYNRGLEYVQYVQRPHYRDTLAQAFRSCPNSVNNLSTLGFQVESLARAVRDYNACVSPAKQQAEAPPTSQRRNWQWAPAIGFGITDRLRLSDGTGGKPLDDVYDGSYYPTVGLSVLFTPGLRGAPFSTNAGLYYEYNRHYTMLYELPGNIQQRTKLAFDYLRLPVFVRYSFGHTIVRPYVEAGIQVQAVTTQRQDELTFISDDMETTQSLFGRPQRMGYGYGAGAGVAFGPVQGRQVQVSVRLMRSAGPSPYTNGSMLTSLATYVAFPLAKAQR